MHSREDVVKLLLAKKGVDPYSTGGVSEKLILKNLTPYGRVYIYNAIMLVNES